MTKIKTLITAFIYMLTFSLINFIIIIIFALGYNLSSKLSINDSNYILELSSFLNTNKISITLLSACVILPVVYRYFQKRNIKINMKYSCNYLYYLILGSTISIIFNIILFYLNLQNLYFIQAAPPLSILSTAVIGPLLEELVFRGVIYNNIKRDFSKITAIILTSLIFGIFHFNLIQGTYAFFLSIIITYYYQREANLFVPILIHCSANLATTIILPTFLNINFEYTQIMFIFLIIIEIICILKIDTNKI